jgi:hypothetical protein
VRTFERACQGKARYSHRRRAKKSARRLKNLGVDGHLSVYRCPFCEQWHVGHIPKVVVQGKLSRDDWARRTS